MISFIHRIYDFNDGRHPLPEKQVFYQSERMVSLSCDGKIARELIMAKIGKSGETYVLILDKGFIWYTQISVEDRFITDAEHYYNYLADCLSCQPFQGHMRVEMIENGQVVCAACSTQNVGQQLVDFLSVPLTSVQQIEINTLLVSIFVDGSNESIRMPKELVQLILTYVSGPYIENVSAHTANTWLESELDVDRQKRLKEFYESWKKF